MFRPVLDPVIRLLVVISLLTSLISPTLVAAHPAQQPYADDGTPQAGFSAMPLSGASPLSVSFNNSSTNASHYRWNFGDGATSSEFAPSHIYTQTGLYTVTLTAGDGVLTDTLSQSGYINVSAPPTPQASFSATPLSGTNPLSVIFANSSIHASYYHWDFGDGTSSSQAKPYLQPEWSLYRHLASRRWDTNRYHDPAWIY